jgi:hypothetical protein
LAIPAKKVTRFLKQSLAHPSLAGVSLVFSLVFHWPDLFRGNPFRPVVEPCFCLRRENEFLHTSSL